MLKHIIKREFKVLAGAKAQRIGTIVTVILILVGGIAGKYFSEKYSDDSSSNHSTGFTIGVTEEMMPYASSLGATGIVEVEDIKQSDAKEWLKNQSNSANAKPSAVLTGTPDKPEIIQSEDQSQDVNKAMVSVISQVSVLNTADRVTGPLTSEAEVAIKQALTPKVTTIPSEGKNLIETNPAAYFASLATQMFLFFAVMTGLSTISIGVVEEKSSRVVEILLSAVKPRTLLLGKILGIGAFILLQMVIYVATGIVALKIAGVSTSFDLGSTVIWVFVWIILGFFTFTTIAGALAATVSRQEDLGAITGPFTMFMFVPFYLGLFLVPAQPDSLLTKIFSFIPGFTPFMMPVRQAYGVVGISEMIAAVAVGIVAVYLLSILAGRIYSNSILHMGKRLKLREALSSKH